MVGIEYGGIKNMRMTEEEYNKITGNQKENMSRRSKYNNRKVWLDGVSFESQKEANYFAEAKIRIKAGELKAIALKPKFVVSDGTLDSRAIIYECDFIEIDMEGKSTVIDVKASEHFTTDLYKLKRSLMLEKYGINIKEVY